MILIRLEQHFHGIAVEGILNSCGRVASSKRHGPQAAGNAAVGLGLTGVLKDSRDFLFELCHSDVAFGLIVPNPEQARLLVNGTSLCAADARATPFCLL